MSALSLPGAVLRTSAFGVVSPAAVVVFVAALAAANGGYFPTAWGWSAVGCGSVATCSLLLRRARRLTRAEVAFAAGLGAIATLALLSSLWSITPARAVGEFTRDVVYPLVVLCALLSHRLSTVRVLRALVLATGVVSGYALATRLEPDRLSAFDPVAGYRLAAPVGYWNALGILCVLGLLPALGLATRSVGIGRLLGSAVVPLLSTTLYFTFSRGSLLALAAGLAVAFLLDPQRLGLAAAAATLALPCGLVVFVVSRSPALTHQSASLSLATREGHRLAALVVAACVVSAASGMALGAAARRVHLGSRQAASIAAAITAAAVLSAAAVVAQVGGPVRLAHGFAAPAPQIHGDLKRRVFSVSGTGRVELWRAAIGEARANSMLGGGAGSYESWWLRNRRTPDKVRDAHSLYVEKFAELGLLGLVTLVGALGVPLVVGIRLRRRPFVPVALGAYTAYLLHAGFDWDWEMPAVTTAALLCGVAVLRASGSERVTRPLGSARRNRALLVVLLGAAVGASFVGLAGNLAMTRARSAASQGEWRRSIGESVSGRSWEPWSPAPWRLIGEAQLALGQNGRAASALHHAIERSPDDWNLWFDLARASSGRAQRDALARAAELDPLSPEIAELERELAAQGSIELVRR